MDFSKSQVQSPELCFSDPMNGEQVVKLITQLIALGNGTHGITKVELVKDSKINNVRKNKCRLTFKKICQ